MPVAMDEEKGCAQWQAHVHLNRLRHGSSLCLWNDLTSYYEALISDTQVPKAYILEPLSCLLSCLSSALLSNNFDCLDVCSIRVCIRGVQIVVKLKDVQLLHNLLFEELFYQLETVFAAINNSSQQRFSIDHTNCPCNTKTDDVVLLLRSCIRIIPLLEFDTSLSQIATTKLASLFQKLCSPSLLREILNSKETVDENFGFVMISDVSCCMDGSTMSFVRSKERVELRGWSQSGISGVDRDKCMKSVVNCLSAILEVFVDELTLHPHLGTAFLNDTIDSTGFISRYKTPSAFGKNIEHSIEAVFCLILLSQGNISDIFLHKLFDVKGLNVRSTNISLPAAVILLDLLILIKAPKIFQAHVLVLVSEAIAIDNIASYSELPMELSLGLHISAFESAVKLYRKHNFLLDTSDHHGGLENRALESCLIKYRFLQAEINRSSNSIINMMWNEKDCIHKHNCCSSHQKSSSKICERHLDNLLQSLQKYITEHDTCLDNLSRNVISSILHRIIVKAFCGVGRRDCLNHPLMNTHSDTCLLASILELLTSSLSRIVFIAKKKGVSGPSSVLEPHLLQTYYDYAIDLLVNCTEQCPFMQPIGTSLNSLMSKMTLGNKKSLAPVVSYFIGELYLMFQMGFELLCKGYVSVLKSLMSLLALENGGIEILTALIESPELSVDSSDSNTENILTQVEKFRAEPRDLSSSSHVLPVIVNFLKKRKHYLSSHIQNLRQSSDEPIDHVDISKCNGKSGQYNKNAFIQSVLKIQTGHAEDPSDLSDFIVCKKGKDYSAWLQKRCRIRKRKYDQEYFERMRRRKEFLSLLSGLE